MTMRIGHGYDVHRLSPGRKLILGGVEIPYARGLLGHSDADVLTHALMDALLGAAGMGDIGHLFPDTDPAYEGADSLELLKTVCACLSREGWSLGNADVTLVAQAPRLSPYLPAMRSALAGAMGAEPGRLNLKATTEEHLGFTGRSEGISAHAVVLIEKK